MRSVLLLLTLLGFLPLSAQLSTDTLVPIELWRVRLMLQDLERYDECKEITNILQERISIFEQTVQAADNVITKQQQINDSLQSVVVIQQQAIEFSNDSYADLFKRYEKSKTVRNVAIGSTTALAIALGIKLLL